MELLKKSIRDTEKTIIVAGVEYKECGHFYRNIFRGVKLTFAMAGIGKSKYLTYPHRVEFIKLPKKNNYKQNARLIVDNFKANRNFIIKSIR